VAPTADPPAAERSAAATGSLLISRVWPGARPASHAFAPRDQRRWHWRCTHVGALNAFFLRSPYQFPGTYKSPGTEGKIVPSCYFALKKRAMPAGTK